MEGYARTLCVDLREANKAVISDGYPLLRFEELLHSMKNCCIFSKLDLSEAYLQLTLHKRNRDLSKGCFALNFHMV